MHNRQKKFWEIFDLPTHPKKCYQLRKIYQGYTCEIFKTYRLRTFTLVMKFTLNNTFSISYKLYTISENNTILINYNITRNQNQKMEKSSIIKSKPIRISCLILHFMRILVTLIEKKHFRSVSIKFQSSWLNLRLY